MAQALQIAPAKMSTKKALGGKRMVPIDHVPIGNLATVCLEVGAS